MAAAEQIQRRGAAGENDVSAFTAAVHLVVGSVDDDVCAKHNLSCPTEVNDAVVGEDAPHESRRTGARDG